jgi:hypothetical protein
MSLYLILALSRTSRTYFTEKVDMLKIITNEER